MCLNIIVKFLTKYCQKVIEMNILRLPAVVIDGKVVSQGKKFSLSEAQELIKSQLPRL